MILMEVVVEGVGQGVGVEVVCIVHSLSFSRNTKIQTVSKMRAAFRDVFLRQRKGKGVERDMQGVDADEQIAAAIDRWWGAKGREEDGEGAKGGMEEDGREGGAAGAAAGAGGGAAEEKEEEAEQALDWVVPIPGQEFALVAFAVPEKLQPTDNWAWMLLGVFPTVEAAEVVQEELLQRDDRFNTYVCKMYDIIARFPPKEAEYKGRVRYRNKHMQDFRDGYRNANAEAKALMQRQEAGEERGEEGEGGQGGGVGGQDELFPLPTTTITATGDVVHGVLHAPPP